MSQIAAGIGATAGAARSEGVPARQEYACCLAGKSFLTLTRFL